MKLSFSLKKQEANLEADVERLIEKHIDQKAITPVKKTRYQIKQEEKRKSEELEHKLNIQKILILSGAMLLFLLILEITSAFH